MGGGKLVHLLRLAVPQPSYISKDDAGSVLALALHCLMVEHGFDVHDLPEVTRYSRLQGPKEWYGKFKDEWVFQYRRPGAANEFVLHCSLQFKTARMFVHASEVGNQKNIQVLGLQLNNYVPSNSTLGNPDWDDDVVQNEESLCNMFQQYIASPLISAAETTPSIGNDATSSANGTGPAQPGCQLLELLKQALPNPTDVLSQGEDAAVLALALHCLMVHDGFQVCGHSTLTRISPYQPLPSWHIKSSSEWVFEYTRDGKANVFTLKCWLQPNSQRLLVHASECGSSNVYALGLQVRNYISVPPFSRSGWSQCPIMDQSDLQTLFKQYITGPVLEDAVDIPAAYAVAPSHVFSERQYIYWTVVPVALVAVTACVCALVWVKKRKAK